MGSEFSKRPKQPKSDPQQSNEKINQEWKEIIPRQPIELGTINYANLTPDGRHGDFDAAVKKAAETGKPIFANFVEWSG
jgi:hypothetical protein